MKHKIYLIGFSLLVLVGFATFSIYNKTKIDTQTSEETKPKNQVLDKETIKQKMQEINKRNAEAFSIDLKNADAETIYGTFNGSNAESIIALLEMDHVDSDRILVSADGTILKGQAIIDENGTEVDSNTDKHGITIKELRDLILLHKEKIDELAAQQGPIE